MRLELSVRSDSGTLLAGRSLLVLMPEDGLRPSELVNVGIELVDESAERLRKDVAGLGIDPTYRGSRFTRFEHVEHLDAVVLTAWVRDMFEAGELSARVSERLLTIVGRADDHDPRGVPVRVTRTSPPKG